MKEVFTITKDDKEVEMAVVSPNAQQFQDANIHYRKVFAKALKEGVMLRSALEKFALEQGIWSVEQEKHDDKLNNDIMSRISILNKGGIPLSQARKVALEIRALREEKQELNLKRTVLDSNTVEGQSEDAKFSYLVSQCTVYNSNGERYFNSLDDYISQSNEPVAYIAASKLMPMLYGVRSDYELALPENQFLTKYKFVNDDLHLVNKDGKMIDDNGRLVDELGRFVNEAGELIDENGNVVVVTASEPFLDDEGNPVA